MYFHSTVYKTKECQSGSPAVSFKDAVLRCLPEEGGLYVPESAPDLRPFFLHMGEETTYPELVAAVTPLLFEENLNPLSASRIAESAFTFEPELIRLDETFSVLNLYNGPTGVFKDFGINFLAALLEEFLHDKKAMVISAVRGTTGAAMARAFQQRQITLTLLYPDEPIYGLESSTYVPQGGNVIPLRVKGTMDDCQSLVNQIIHDRSFAERYKITSANAVNPGRLLPQAFYFLYSFIKLKKYLTGELMFSIPSGNFGNLIAALYAWKFGLPVNGYIAAMNRNNSFGTFIRSGNFADFKGRPIISTISPALDISRPSNLERLESFYDTAPVVMRNMVFPESIDDENTLLAMEKAWNKYHIHLDPHGAVAFAAAERQAVSRDFDGHIVVLATGHPAKYTEKALLPEKLASLNCKSDPIAEIDPDLEGLESAIASCF
jgi:threonine synthase